jgi:hypothetical protein
MRCCLASFFPIPSGRKSRRTESSGKRLRHAARQGPMSGACGTYKKAHCFVNSGLRVLSNLGIADSQLFPLEQSGPSSSFSGSLSGTPKHKVLLLFAATYENPSHLVRGSSHVGAVFRTSVPRSAPKGHYRELGELLGLLR